MRLMEVVAILVLATALPARAQDGEPDGGLLDRNTSETLAATAAQDAGSKAPPSGPTKPAAPAYEIVVRGRQPISRDRTQDTTEVSGQALRDSPRASTFEALSQQAGDLYVSARGAFHGVSDGATGGIHIRGLGGSPNSQILVVEDGVPDYQGIFGHPIPDAYVPFLIDQALIVKGGDSVLYGTNALGGAIVIRSRWRAGDGYEVLSDSAYGSYATLRESASLLGRSGPWDIASAIQVLSTAGHREGAGGNEMVGAAAARYRFTPDLSLTLRNKVVHLEGADPGTASHPYTDHWYDVWRDNASAQVNWNSDRVRMNLTPYLNLGIHRLYDGFYSVDTVAGGHAEADVTLHRMAQLLLGLATEHVDGHVENRITDEHLAVRALTDVAVYGQLTLRPFERVVLSLGVRELYSSAYDYTFLYKAGMRWDLPGGFFVHTRVTHNFRQPTIRELYLPFPVANPDLRPEYSTNTDLGFGYASEHIEVSCTGYRTQATDLIKYFGAWPTAEVINISHIVIRGVEGSVALKQLGPASLHVTGDWQDVGRYTRQNPNAKLNFTLDVGRTRGERFWGASLSGEWVHGLFMADYSRQPMDDVFVMDASLRYRYSPAERGLTVEPYLLIRNLLDQRYAYVDGYPMPGFNLLGGLKVGI